MNSALIELEREIDRLKQRVRRVADLEEVTVPGAARLLKKTPLWVRRNLPVIKHSKHCRSHHVLITDIEAYHARRRELPPINGKKMS